MVISGVDLQALFPCKKVIFLWIGEQWVHWKIGTALRADKEFNHRYLNIQSDYSSITKLEFGRHNKYCLTIREKQTSSVGCKAG